MDNQALFERIQENREKGKAEFIKACKNKEEEDKIELEDIKKWTEMVIKSDIIQDRIINITYSNSIELQSYKFNKSKTIDQSFFDKYNKEEYVPFINNILIGVYSDKYISYSCDYKLIDNSAPGNSDRYHTMTIYWKKLF